MTLHSNLVLFKSTSLNNMVAHIPLYIPIWFYSNKELSDDKVNANDFTFQSGYIQMSNSCFVYANESGLQHLVIYKSPLKPCK